MVNDIHKANGNNYMAVRLIGADLNRIECDDNKIKHKKRTAAERSFATQRDKKKHRDSNEKRNKVA